MSERAPASRFDVALRAEGELVILRPLRAEDFGDLYAVASDPLVWEQHPSRDRYKEEVFRRFFDEAIRMGSLAVLDRATGRMIGSSRFHQYEPTKSQVEIGYSFLARSHWGGAINGEVKRRMLAHAFRFVDTVVFLVGPTNMRSRCALEKIGARLAGSCLDEQRGERVVYRIEKKDFVSTSSAP